MDCDTLICQTESVPAIKPSKDFEEAAAAKVRAEELLERRREVLLPLVAAEVARGVKLATIGRLAGYTPEHVRRIARAHGVDAAVDREPPPPRRKPSTPEH